VVTNILSLPYLKASDNIEDADKTLYELTNEVKKSYKDIIFYSGKREAQKILLNILSSNPKITSLVAREEKKNWISYISAVIDENKELNLLGKSAAWKGFYEKVIISVFKQIRLLAKQSQEACEERHGASSERRCPYYNPAFDAAHWTRNKE
jgi:hypothetical protein